MAWVIIPDSDTDPDSPITTGLITGLRDNTIESAPTGMPILWALATAPSGYLECDGSSLSRTTYAALYAVLGVTYGNVDGNTFNLPDYRGEFLRVWDNGAAVDPDRASRTDRGDGTAGDNMGTKQADQYKSHSHSRQFYTGSGSSGPSKSDNALNSTTPSTGASGGNETRGTNVYVMVAMRYTGN